MKPLHALRFLLVFTIVLLLSSSALAFAQGPEDPNQPPALAVELDPPLLDLLVETTDAGPVISWRTVEPQTGWIEYGATWDQMMNIAYDEHGQEASDTVHRVVIGGLEPGAVVYYTIVSGGLRVDDGGAPFKFAAGRDGFNLEASEEEDADKPLNTLAEPVESAEQVAPTGVVNDFINRLAPWAQAEQRDSGVPASFSIAQAMYESGCHSDSYCQVSTLAGTYNNYHGIKCSPPNEGLSCVSLSSSSWNRYSSGANGFLWHGRWLRGNGNYAPAFNHTDNPLTFAQAVLNCYTGRTPACPTPGTASFPQNYYNFIAWAISTYNLRQFDFGGCSANQYRAEYFNNRTLSGSPTFTRCEGQPINYDWGAGGPGNGLGNDNFSTRWQGRFDFSEGTRTFIARSDDGIRVWVDGLILIDAWSDHGPTEFRANRPMSAGSHEVKVEFYENSGGAVAQVRWEQAATGDPDDNRALTSGQTLNGTINPANDQDAYYFDASQGQRATIRMNRTSGNLDSYLYLYAPNGALVTQDDDSGGSLNSLINQVSLPQTGRYRIVARSYAFGSTGGYSIGLTLEGSGGGGGGGALVSNLRISSGRGYSMGTCSIGSRYYIDRDYTITGFSHSDYNGLPCLRTANDDKYNTSGNLFEFDLSRPARIYIYWDPRAGSDRRPNWMKSLFAGNGKRINVSDSGMGYFEIYSCDSTPGHIVLGGPRSDGGNNNGSMYVVGFREISAGERRCSR
ncbi:MAG: glucosaminidase domain-containing protein [Caldilineales bacterium]|nr:glucosaminidase domain-containing protein [Caldilineales bacterium]MCW5858342.1 glucosaminidase domain-containing protein [Caldilineales bacterium]